MPKSSSASLATVPATAGRMTIDLLPNGTSRPTPRITFDPVGLFTPGLLHDYLPHFAQEIERAHATQRASERIKKED